MRRFKALVTRTVHDLNRPVLWGVLALLVLAPLALGPGVLLLGVTRHVAGVRGLQQLFFSVLLPLFVLAIPLFHRVALRQNKERDFRTIQLGISSLDRFAEALVYLGVVVVPVLFAGVLEVAVLGFMGRGASDFLAFWGPSLALAGLLVFAGWFLTSWVESLFEASLLLFGTWLTMVLGWDALLVVLVVLEVPAEVTELLGVLNPVSLYRFELYRLVPDLRPALKGHLPGVWHHLLGRVLWLVVLPGWILLRDE